MSASSFTYTAHLIVQRGWDESANLYDRIPVSVRIPAGRVMRINEDGWIDDDQFAGVEIGYQGKTVALGPVPPVGTEHPVTLYRITHAGRATDVMWIDVHIRDAENNLLGFDMIHIEMGGVGFPDFADAAAFQNYRDTAEVWGHAPVDGLFGPEMVLDWSAFRSLAGIEGTEGPDVLIGTDGPDLLLGGLGNDRLYGGAGNDTLRGGDGADTLNGGDGDDFLFGGDTEADLRDVIYGGDGDDRIDGGWGNDELWGGAGNDTLLGDYGSDTLIGNEGHDQLHGGAGSDEIHGGPGDDWINGGWGYDRLNGGAGADSFFHQGVADHGSDWVQDYRFHDGDVLAVGIPGATRDQFQVNFANTPSAGSAEVAEAFVIYKPTQQILFALVDGAGQDGIVLRLSGQDFDLLA